MTNEEIDIINSMRPMVIKSLWLKKGIDYRDIMQDLFLKILENYEKFAAVREGEKLYYVTRVCKNMLIDKWRKGKYQYSIAKITSIFIGHSDDYDDKCDISYALQTKAEADSRMDLKDVLSLLKTYDKSDALLLNCEGYKFREIAEFTGHGIDTVLSHARYTRNFLNKNYVQENQKKKKANTNCESQSCQRADA